MFFLGTHRYIFLVLYSDVNEFLTGLYFNTFLFVHFDFIILMGILRPLTREAFSPFKSLDFESHFRCDLDKIDKELRFLRDYQTWHINTFLYTNFDDI